MQKASNEDRGDLRKLQLIELDILKEVVRACKKNHLEYFLMGGTFLGAVRHKGFIPWDDDIDVALPRRDFEKLLKIIEANNGKYKLVDFKNTSEYREYVPKLQNTSTKVRLDGIKNKKLIGAWIDIFPLDGMPNNKIARQLHKFRLLSLRALIKLSDFDNQVDIKRNNRTLIERLIVYIGEHSKLFLKMNTKNLLWRLDAALCQYSYDTSRYVVNFMGAYKFKEMFPKKIYDEKSLYDFETEKFYAPKNYNVVLSQMYGDYMKVPPRSQQNKHHSKVIEEK